MVYNRGMQIIKEILKFIGKILILALVVGSAFFAYYEYKINGLQNISLRNFSDVAMRVYNKDDAGKAVAPAPENPQDKKFTWTYAGKQYSITETLYASTDTFYQSSPKEFLYSGNLENNWEEKYFAMFLKENDSEKIFHQVATDIQSVGKKNGLNDDQIVELVMAFVQSIQYDEARATAIAAGSKEALTNYPYETLFLQKGVCADKSFLASMILRDLGYGTVLFVYDSENHMAVGIQCPMQYSNYNSGYCFAETTAVGMRIGVIPDLNKANNQANDLKKLSYFDQSSKFDEKKLGEVKILQKTTGKEYGGVAGTIKISQSIENTGKAIVDARSSLTSLKAKVESDQSSLDALKKKMDTLKKSNNIEDYNNLVPKYNDQISSTKKDIDKYNAQVKNYNSLVDKYNSLVGSF